MGLLDSFQMPDLNDPKNVGLLSMAASLMQGRKGKGLLGNLGAAGMTGLQSVFAAQDAGLKRKLTESQIGENESQAAARNLKAQQDAAFQKDLNDALTRMQGSLGAQMPPPMDLVNTFNSQRGLPLSPGQSSPAVEPQFPSFSELARFKAKGVDLLPIVEKAVTGFGMDAGKTYVNPSTGQERTIPKLPDFVQMQGGRAVLPPGALETVGALKAAEIGAQQAATLPFDIERYRTQADMRPFKVEAKDGSYLTSELGATQGQQPPVAPRGAQNPQFQIPPQVQAQRDGGRVQILQQEYALAKTPQDREAITRELAIMGAKPQQSAPGIPLKSDAEKQREEAAIKIDADRAAKADEAAVGKTRLFSNINRMRELIGTPENPKVLGATPQERIAALGPAVGISTPKTVNTVELKRLGQELVLSMSPNGSLSAQVSNTDAKRFEQAAGEFNRAKTVPDMLMALNGMEQVAQQAFENAAASRKALETGQQPGNRPRVLNYNPATGKLE